MTTSSTERWSYFQLIGSLPPLPADFTVNRLPISGPRLEERLRRLPEADRVQIDRLRDLLFWDRQKLALDDKEIARRYEDFLEETSNAVLHDIVTFRMDVRTIIAALRRRRLDKSPPSEVGECVSIIRRNWQEPSLGLGARFAWVAKLDRQLMQGEVEEANQLILDVVYTKWSRMASQYQFCFEAIALYVARWDVLDRWVGRNADVGRERLEQLVTEAIGDHGRLS